MNRWLPAILIFAILAAFRILGGLFPATLPNFQPLFPILLCSLIFLQGRQRWIIPLIAWVLTDPLMSLLQKHEILAWQDHLSMVLGILPVIAIALWTRRNATTPRVLAAAIYSAVIFYFITNCASFLLDPLYAKTWHGFVQAQWTGPDHLGPTWVFLRNMAAGNLLFTALFLIARKALPLPEIQHVTAVAR